MEDIFINKQLIIDHDRKRNGNREALNQIKKLSGEKKLWMNLGDMFIKLPVENTKSVIEQDQKSLDNSINEARTAMKEKMTELDRLEGKTSMVGFALAGMTAKDLYDINKKM
ncbi:p53 and DNA damage-regulated protein 1 [Apophysomyces ossiformis]|uniref:p53 and DNA damage-regulated protein 1 n=1 Tax=Apophysomyces ossiformis TaxID=679940 RepID=A0A8H7BLM5_9FUNG|nr:p53 and DNA damage-regulated protein 1 [Apophysomyces ossiformis]